MYLSVLGYGNESILFLHFTLKYAFILLMLSANIAFLLNTIKRLSFSPGLLCLLDYRTVSLAKC